MKFNIKIIILLVIIFASGMLLYFEKSSFINIYKFYKSNSNTDYYLDHYGTDIEFHSDGLRIKGTIYSNDDETLKPGIIIVHGASISGRKLPLYRIMAKKFADNGNIVLTFDARGAGESETFNESGIESFAYNDTIDAIEYLLSIKNVDSSRIYIICHSGGCYQGAKAALQNEKIKKIVLIGPPRRVESRVLDKNAPDLLYFWKRYNTDKKVNISLDEYYYMVANSLGYLNRLYFSEKHIPVLLIDGELENYDDKGYLKNIFINMKEPVKYVTINNTGHYANTTSFGEMMLYNDKIMDNLVKIIDNWIRDTE